MESSINFKFEFYHNDKDEIKDNFQFCEDCDENWLSIDQCCSICKSKYLKLPDTLIINNPNMDINDYYKDSIGLPNPIENLFCYSHTATLKYTIYQNNKEVSSFSYRYLLFFVLRKDRDLLRTKPKKSKILLHIATVLDNHLNGVEGYSIICNDNGNIEIETTNSDSRNAIATLNIDSEFFNESIKPYINFLNTVLYDYVAVIGDKYIGLARNHKEYIDLIKETALLMRFKKDSLFHKDFLPLDIFNHIFKTCFINSI